MINVTQSPMTVADYCQAYQEKKIIVNRSYQRSWEVWPAAARSFLIESIILGYPVPKLSLHQKLDLRSREISKEIVDGQQRTRAIYDFYMGKIRLSRSLETKQIAGRLYEELEEEHQQAFLSYSLSIDLFVGATDAEIREVFRRMNSHTVPLNPEEERHSSYQGEFKWYVYHLSRSVETFLSTAEVINNRGFVRMQDAKLLTDITYAILYGIKTTNKKDLNKIYKTFDEEFPERDNLNQRLTNAFSFLGELEDIYKGPLMTTYHTYAMVLAVTHLLDPVESLQELWPVTSGTALDKEAAETGLLKMADALDNKDDYKGPLQAFLNASAKSTNVKDRREERFKWFCEALLGNLS